MTTLHAVRPLAVLSLSLLSWLVGCGGTTSADARYSTPEHTLATVLASYGLTGLTPDEVRTMRRERRLRLQDPVAYHACFVRFDSYLDEALAGYIVGALAENPEPVQPQIVGDVARVPIAGKTTIVLRKKDGAWRIDLDTSVSSTMRAKLQDVVRRAEKMTRRHGALPAP